MTLQLRHPLVENQYCSFDAASGETLPVAAGTIVKVVGETSDGRVLIDVVSDAANDQVFGWLMQKVKAEYTDFPPNFRLRGDLGSTDAFLGDPVGVAMGPGAVYETTEYVDNGLDGITAGDLLRCDDDGKLEDTDTDSGPTVAIAMQTLTAAETLAGKALRVKSLL